MKQHSRVKLLSSINEHGHQFSPGWLGVVVHIYEGAKAYEVELDGAPPVVVTLLAAQVELVQS